MLICRMMGAMQRALDTSKAVDFLAPLAMRFYLAPVMWMAANTKWNPLDPESSLDSTIQWLGNPDWGLDLPFPELLGYLAWGGRVFWCYFSCAGFCSALDIHTLNGHDGCCCMEGTLAQWLVSCG